MLFWNSSYSGAVVEWSASSMNLQNQRLVVRGRHSRLTASMLNFISLIDHPFPSTIYPIHISLSYKIRWIYNRRILDAEFQNLDFIINLSFGVITGNANWQTRPGPVENFWSTGIPGRSKQIFFDQASRIFFRFHAGFFRQIVSKRAFFRELNTVISCLLQFYSKNYI
jgi:hypothetical protein